MDSIFSGLYTLKERILLKSDIPKILLCTEIKVYEILYLNRVTYFNDVNKRLWFSYSNKTSIKGICIRRLLGDTNYQQLESYSKTCNFDTSSVEDYQLTVMAKYFGNIIDRSSKILATNGKLLCELIIANGIKSLDYNYLKQLPLIFNSQLINHIVKTEKSKCKKYRKGINVDCRNDCGNHVLIEIPGIFSELPICCQCKTPNRPCVECTNHKKIKKCGCGRFFHKDPDYRGDLQKCEICR